MTEETNHWNAIELWCAGDSELAAAIQRTSHLRKVPRENALVSAGDPQGDVYFILTGSFSIIRYSVSGYEVRLNTLVKGDWVGEMAALNETPRSAFVIAVEDSLVAAMPRQGFLGLMNEYSGFSTRIAKLLSNRLVETSRRMFEFAAVSSSDRVYSEMIRLSAPASDIETRLVTPPPSVTELAARLSMARETASRAISRLEKMRLLIREPSCWQIIVPPQILNNDH